MAQAHRTLPATLARRITALDYSWDATAISDLLVALAQHFSAIYIHPRLICFPDSRYAANSALGEAPDCDQYRDFLRALGRPANVHLGLFGTPISTWVGTSDPDYEQWLQQHSWLAAVIRRPHGNGKIVIIVDSCPRPAVTNAIQQGEKPRRHQLLGYQKRLLDRFPRSAHVLYSLRPGRGIGADHCQRDAFEALIRIANLGNQPWAGPEDPRGRGCVRIEP